MPSLRYLRSFAAGLAAVLATLSMQTSPALADCPPGSGIEFPTLTQEEFACQRASLNATVSYFYNFIGARQDCFTHEIKGDFPPGSLDCLAAVTAEGPSTTGDEDADKRLRKAEASLTASILNRCTGVALEKIGYPGFCEDATPLTPYDAFDHVQCLLTYSQNLGTYILNSEHPPTTGDVVLPFNERQCQDEIGRLSSRMTSTEFDRRGHCLLAQVRGDLALPPEVDCRREIDPQDPGINRPYTEDAVIESHNHILVYLPNQCPAINLTNLDFPWLCPHAGTNSVFPLPALVQCMWDFHHSDVFRFIDVIFPCSTKCGNGILNVEEDCDDGDNDYMNGDFCRRDCSQVPCGDTNNDGEVNIVDSLYALRAAIGLEQCTLLVCDVTGDLKIRASDALRLLQWSVGLPVTLDCPDLSTTCGNGFLEAKEDCDDGDSVYMRGEFCNSACLLVPCGDTDDSGTVNILDAQYILNVGVGNVTCDLSVCDITGNLLVNSTDALRALMWAVGLPINFNCPAPPETPPAPPVE